MAVLTKRQTIFLVIICLLASKVQRLPSLIATPLGRHGYLVFLIMGLIDVLMLLVCLLFNKLSCGATTYLVLQKTGGTWIAKLVYAIFAFYFFFNAILPYEAVHDLFGNILFDRLSWGTFSLLLVITIFFVSTRGLQNLGRLAEIFFYLIIISFAVLLTLGLTTSDLSQALPLCDIDFSTLFATCFKYNLWFGDFLIIYMFVGKIKENEQKLGLSLIIAMLVTTLILALAYIVFYGLYQDLSSEQNSLISSISQFSLRNLDIGRIDWFFVLFFQFSTLISSATNLYLTASALAQIFTIKNMDRKKQTITFDIICGCVVLGVYILDIYLFKSNQEGVSIMASITKHLGAFTLIILPLILLMFAIAYNKKRKKQENTIKNRLQTLKFAKSSHRSLEKTNKKARLEGADE